MVARGEPEHGVHDGEVVVDRIDDHGVPRPDDASACQRSLLRKTHLVRILLQICEVIHGKKPF